MGQTEAEWSVDRGGGIPEDKGRERVTLVQRRGGGGGAPRNETGFVETLVPRKWSRISEKKNSFYFDITTTAIVFVFFCFFFRGD